MESLGFDGCHRSCVSAARHHDHFKPTIKSSQVNAPKTLVGHAKNDRIGRMMTMTHFLCFSCSFLERNFPTTMESRMTTPSTTQDRSFRWDTSEMWKDSPFVRGNPHQYKGNNKRVFPNASKRFVERYAKGQTRHPAGCELQLSPPATPTTTTRARASRRVLDRQRV